MVDFKIIGGVKFNEKDIVSSEKISQDGKEYNSVFLKDGTKIIYPDQNPDDKAYVEASVPENEIIPQNESILAMTPQARHMMQSSGSRHRGHNSQSNQPEKKIVSIGNFNGGTVFGTDKKDDLRLEGCSNMVIDISQKDGQKDEVTLFDNLREGGFLGPLKGVKHQNKNNTILYRDEDKIYDGHFLMNKRNEHIKVDD